MEPQQAPAAPRRVRRRSLAGQLQVALDDAAKAATADISTQKLIQTRIDCLLKLQARDRNDKLRKMSDELRAVRAENARIKDELAIALAAKPRSRPLSEVEQALAKYEASKNGGTA